jgi:hypothetical protein
VVEPKPRIPIQYEYVSDQAFSDALFRAAVRQHARKPVVVIWLVAGVVLIVWGTALLTTGRPPALALIVLGAFDIYVFAIAPILALRRGRSTGRRFGIGVGDTALALEGPGSTSEVDFIHFLGIARRDGLLQLDHAEGYTSYYPEHLLPDSVIDDVRLKIEAARPRT